MKQETAASVNVAGPPFVFCQRPGRASVIITLSLFQVEPKLSSSVCRSNLVVLTALLSWLHDRLSPTFQDISKKKGYSASFISGSSSSIRHILMPASENKHKLNTLSRFSSLPLKDCFEGKSFSWFTAFFRLLFFFYPPCSFLQGCPV